jgi:mannose-6-phosphate isomerase-like protein (cupin superfamily)
MRGVNRRAICGATWTCFTKCVALLVFGMMCPFGAKARERERSIDPTFLARSLDDVKEQPSDLSTPNCQYKPVFDQGDKDAATLHGVARFGEVIVNANGACALVQYPHEDQVYVVLEGSGSVRYGEEQVLLTKGDYLYLPATVRHTLINTSTSPLKVIIVGFRTEHSKEAALPPHALKANIADVPLQEVSGHPSSTLYRLLMGDATSKRDRIAAGHVLTSLFLMEIAPGGTNFPHHHEREEEIYLVLDGYGDMVAGGGMDGIEGRHPAKAGDAYFFRLNCTVGYYSSPQVKSRVLGIRSWYPGMAEH